MSGNSAKDILALYDSEAENRLLAFMLKATNDALVDDVARRLEPGMFSDLKRQVIFEAAKDLRGHGYPVTPDGLIAKGREIAKLRKYKSSGDIITKRDIARYDPIDIEGADVKALSSTVSELSVLRDCTDEVEGIIGLIGQRPQPGELTNRFLALISAINMRQSDRVDEGIYRGADLGNIINEMLDEIESSSYVDATWPWRAMAAVDVPLPSTMGLYCMRDGAGKSSWAETLSRHMARVNGLNVFYVATEYNKEVLMARLLSQMTGIRPAAIMRNKYSPAEGKKLRNAGRLLSERYPTLTYLGVAGKNIDEIIGLIYAQDTRPHVVIFDYAQDVAMGPYERDETQKIVNATRKFHIALRKMNAIGFMLSQGRKDMLDIGGWGEFRDEMINMPATALAKCQLRMVGLRKLLSSPGEDPEWDEAGNEKIPGTGEAGQMSRIVHIASFKDSIGPNFRTALQITPNMRILDLPLSTMTRLGLRFPDLQYERVDLTKVGQ